MNKAAPTSLCDECGSREVRMMTLPNHRIECADCGVEIDPARITIRLDNMSSPRSADGQAIPHSVDPDAPGNTMNPGSAQGNYIGVWADDPTDAADISDDLRVVARLLEEARNREKSYTLTLEVEEVDDD